MFEHEGGVGLADRPDRATAKPKEPTKHNVILYDDDDHSFTYVMEMLREVFAYDNGKAYELTEELVENGKVIVFTAPTRAEADLMKDKLVSFGRDKHIKACAGAMTVTVESL